MECKYVPIWNVSPCGGSNVDNLSIQDVLADFDNVKTYKDNRNIDLKDIFVSPNIKSNFIHEDWCNGANDEERFNELSVDDPISCYDYIQYGGCEDEITTPEIYFSNLKGWNVDDVELLEGGEIEYVDGFPFVPITLDPRIIQPYYVDRDIEYPGDARARYMPAYYREGGEEYLQRYGISSKVKVDNEGELPDNVQFKFKVSIVLGSDYVAGNQYYYKAGDSFENGSPHQIPFPLVATLPPLAVAAEAKIGEGVLWNIFKGPLVEKLTKIGVKIGEAIYLGGFGSLTAGLIIEYVALRTLVESADFIFDLFAELNQNDIESGYKLWDIVTGGKYNNYDIRESSIEFNNNTFKYAPFGNYTEKAIAKDGIYNSNVYNYNNLDLSKWFNFETKPKGTPYDKMTPPPNTMYIVEIIPVSNCTISDDPKKPHIISFSASPDKYVKPNFDVLPSNMVCASSLVRLQDAIHADFIYFKDLERSNLFDSYHNTVINTGNYKNNEATVNVEYIGEDIIEFIDILSDNRGGQYEVLFMKEIGERNQQFIFNSNFVDRGYGTDAYKVIKKYWNLPSNWVYSGGAIYRNDNNDTTVTQYCEYMSGSVNWDALYRVDIEVVNSSNGSAYIELDGTFTNRICADKYDGGGDNPRSVKVIELDQSSYPEGVSLVGSRVYFYGNKYHRVYLQARSSTTIDKIIKIGGTSDFNGGISSVNVRRISPYSPTSSERAVPMYNEVIDISNCPNGMTLYLLVSYNIDYTLSINLGDFEYGDYSQFVDVDFDWGDGSAETIRMYSGRQIVTHNYTTQQFGISYLVAIRVNGYVKAENSAILPYLECHNSYVIDYADYYGLTYKGTVDLSETNLRSTSIIDAYTNVKNASVVIDGTAEDGSHSTYNIFDGTYTYIPMLSRFLGLKQLILNNTNINNDLVHLGGVSEYIDIDNTNIFGDLSELSLVSDTIRCNNTKVNTYNSNTKMRCLHIYWQDSDPIMDVNDLNDLCRDIYNSTMMNGILHIASNNPDIREEEILYFIFKLVHDRNWTIVYNGYYITTDNLQNYQVSGTDDYIYAK